MYTCTRCGNSGFLNIHQVMEDNWKERKVMENEIVIDGITHVKKDEMAQGGYCIVRTYSAGVFAGNLTERTGKEGVILNARRLWRWSGAASLSQLAMEGTSAPNDCKFPCVVSQVTLTEIIEIIPCTKVAKESIQAVAVWSA